MVRRNGVDRARERAVIVAGSALAYRSFIAAEQGRPEDQRLLAETAMEFVWKHGVEKVDGEAPLALGASLAACGRPGEARPLIERAVRSCGPPLGELAGRW